MAGDKYGVLRTGHDFKERGRHWFHLQKKSDWRAENVRKGNGDLNVNVNNSLESFVGSNSRTGKY